MAAHGGIADDLLFKLAETSRRVSRYTETNRIEGLVTCKGTRAMLFDWRQTVKPCDQHHRLEQALIDAKLVMLADTHLRVTPNKGISSDPGIYRKKISASLTVQRCREKLEKKYRHQLCKIQMRPWDQSDYAEFKDMHTVVTMVKKDARGQDTKKKEILQGSVAEIFSTKVNGELPARILISAPAGRGKTTAVAKMAYDWVYLDDQPLINELVKTPLFCLMVCHLWSEERLDTETATQTELLDSVNVFLMHHANARATSTYNIAEEELIEIIRKLGEVALAGLIDDSKKLVFTPHDFRRVPAILDRACELGILSKTTIPTTMLPRSHNTTSTTIEFYHKLVQEHSAGKYLAAKTKKYTCMLRLKISKLDRLLRNIKANIGDYENLIRFAAGTDNGLCIRIMETLLSNRFLDESERYRILLDCSSETKGTQQDVSSLVQRCVNAESIVLKSPTVYTVVGMQNLPKQLKRQVRTVKFEGSTLTTDVTSGLWSCLKDFSMLDTLVISDSSLSFPPFLPVLISVTNLSAEIVTSQSYEGVLPSIPGVRDIDVSIDVAETSNTFQITTASRPMNQTMAMDEQFFVHIRLHALKALTTDRKTESGETIGGLSLLFEDQTKKQQRLHVSGVRGRDEETLVDLLVKTKQLTYLNSRSGGGTLDKKNNVQLH
eukprot:XP_011664517.1 PREDICTED: uncharacterized protein LOC105438428 [Strongylocentrotus purpuratus]